MARHFLKISGLAEETSTGIGHGRMDRFSNFPTLTQKVAWYSMEAGVATLGGWLVAAVAISDMCAKFQLLIPALRIHVAMANASALAVTFDADVWTGTNAEGATIHGKV